MKQIRSFFRGIGVLSTLWIAVCFSITSLLYLSWVYRLTDFFDSTAVDAISMVLGYGLQAAGIGLVCRLIRKNRSRLGPSFRWTLGCFLLIASAAAFSSERIICLCAGLIMNLLCGMITGYYLDLPPQLVAEKQQGKSFGIGYALSVILVWLISLPGQGSLLRSRAAILIGVVLAVGAAWIPYLLKKNPDREEEKENHQESTLSGKELGLAAGTVFLLSLVKNLGFSFPTADVLAGMPLELSRIFYAVGLVTAGVICDRNRRTGAICTVAALGLPFMMLALSGQPVSAFLCWSLDYLFYGFFSVFRVIVFWDLARERKQRWLAPMGLLAGRLGDAAGTAICLALGAAPTVLILLSMGLFILTVFVSFRFFQWQFEPSAVHPRGEQEIFEEFAMRHDLSPRERDVLRLLLREKTNAEIAENLYVSESTAKYHVHNLLQKTGCRNRGELLGEFKKLQYPALKDVGQKARVVNGNFPMDTASDRTEAE